MRTLSTVKRSKSYGQHSLPDNPYHTGQFSQASPKRVYAYKVVKGDNEPKFIKINDFPDRLYGSVKATRYGGEATVDQTPTHWEHGEFWNRDSLIKKWKEHEVRRQAAKSAHDIHRYDQWNPIITTEKCSYSLGLRDRQGVPTSLWWPVSKFHQFRSPENYANFFDHHRSGKLSRDQKSSMFRSLSSKPSGGSQKMIGGIQFGSTSLEGWDGWAHANARECAKTSLRIHGQQYMAHPWGIPHDKLDVRPGLIYSKKFKKHGQEVLRDHVPRSIHVDRGRGGVDEVDEDTSPNK